MERLTNPNLSQLGGKHTKVQVKVRAHTDNLSSVKYTLGRARGTRIQNKNVQKKTLLRLELSKNECATRNSEMVSQITFG